MISQCESKIIKIQMEILREYKFQPYTFEFSHTEYESLIKINYKIFDNPDPQTIGELEFTKKEDLISNIVSEVDKIMSDDYH